MQKLNLEQLLRLGVSAARAGNRSAARALFLALTREYPDDVRPWLWLAGAAADMGEQRAALERVIAIDPGHPKAAQALARLAPAVPLSHLPAAKDAPDARLDELSPAPPWPEPVFEAPPPEGELPPAEASRFPLLNRIALATIALLLIVLVGIGIGIVQSRSGEATSLATPSPMLQTDEAVSMATAPPAAAPTAPGEPPTIPAPAPTGLAAPTGAPSTQPISPPVSTPTPASLPLGTLVEVDGWSTTLIQPDYALVLDGSIGDLRPAGRFVLALMAVSNNSTAERRIPADLFILVDDRGRRYSPAPNASTAYLALYERGQRGDLALEDPLAPQSGMRSVPILFDVPADAGGLVLTVSGGPTGWPVGRPEAPPTNAGP
jgi:hypothetical protein